VGLATLAETLERLALEIARNSEYSMATINQKKRVFSFPSLKAALRDAFFTSGGIVTTFLGKIANTVDWTLTWFRLAQVFNHVWTNSMSDDKVASDTSNQDSLYDQNVGAKTIAGATLVAMTIGVGFYLYDLYRQYVVKSYHYVKERLHGIKNFQTLRHRKKEKDLGRADGVMDKVDILLDAESREYRITTHNFNYFLKHKIAGGKKYEIDRSKNEYIELKSRTLKAGALPQGQKAPTKKASEPASASKKTIWDNLADYINSITGHPISKAIRSIWDWAGNYSFVFWIVAAPFIVAGTIATIPMSGLLIATLAIGTGLLALKVSGALGLLMRVLQAKNKQAEYARLKGSAKEEEEQQKEKELIIFKLRLREQMKQLHAATMHSLDEKYKEKKVKVVTSSKTSGKEGFLRKRLLANQKLRFIVHVLREIASVFVMVSFVAYFASLVLSALIVPAIAKLGLSALAANTQTFAVLLADTVVSTQLGAMLAAVLGVTAMAKSYADWKEYEKKVDEKLAEYYKEDTGRTKAQEFEYQEEAVNVLKQKLVIEKANLEKNLASGIFKEENLSAAQKKLLAYDFDAMQFDNLADTHSTGAILLEVWNYLFAFLGGTQSGFYVGRSLLLIGGIGAGVTLFALGASVTFFALAAVAALAIGILNVTKYHLDRDHQRQQTFLDTVDEQISLLRKESKALGLLHDLFFSETKQPLRSETAPLEDDDNMTEEPLIPLQYLQSSDQGEQPLDGDGLENFGLYARKPHLVGGAASTLTPIPSARV